MALADVEEILIQASYSTTTMRSTITNVVMETASESDLMSEPALEVEHCVCPDGYEGLSCEVGGCCGLIEFLIKSVAPGMWSWAG